MSEPPHYWNRAYTTDGVVGGIVDINELGDGEIAEIQDEDTADDIDEESSDEEQGIEEEEEETAQADVDVHVVVVTPGVVLSNGHSGHQGGSPVGGLEGPANQAVQTKKVSLKSLVIPDHLLHKKYQAPCHALCTVRSPKHFITCVAIVFFIHGLFTQYSYHTIIGAAARYPFSQMELRFMNGLEHTGIVVGVVFMSFFSNRFNRPVAIAVGALMCAVGSIFCAIPHFAEGTMDNASFREISLFLRGETCQKYNLSFTFQGTCNLVANQKYSDILAFSMICVGQFIVGLGASLYITNSLVHIEESVSFRDSTVCLGVCLSVHGLGMFGGSLMATGFSALPEGITGAYPLVAFREKVGAWWLGFCITAGLFFFSGLLFLCFPRWFVEPDWLLRRRERYYKKLVARKKQADRHKKKLLSRKLKKEKAASKKVSPEANENGARRGKKAAQDAPKNNRSNQRGADFIRVPNLLGERDPTVEETDDVGSNPIDRGAVNSAFLSEDERRDNEIQESQRDVRANRNKKESNRHSTNNGQVNDTRQEATHESTEVGTKTIHYIKKNRKNRVQKKYLMRREQFKDISRHIWRLLRNKPLALCFCGTVLCSYTVTGYTAILTTYLKVRFHQGHHSAEFATAFITPLGFCVGTLIGGMIVGGVEKLRENLHLSSRLIVGTLPVTIICMIVLMFLSCDIKDHTASLLKNPGNWTCHERCDCTDTLQDPVCGDDGYVYPSACLAGCHYIDSNPEPMKYTFSTCECIDTPSARASYGVCPTECIQFYIYVAIAAVGMVAYFIGLVPVLMIFLRAVRDRYRSLSIGFGVWLVYILGYIIGPVMFNEILNFQCAHSTDNCHKEVKCWYYDLQNLGFMLHGVVVMFLGVGMIFFIAMCVLLMPGRFTNPANESTKLALDRVGDTSNIANIPEIE